MKRSMTFLGLTFFILASLNNCTKQEDFPVLQGPYLGQKPPEMTPEIFAPRIMENYRNWFNVVYSPDGNELYFVTDIDANETADILWMRNIDGIWTDP